MNILSNLIDTACLVPERYILFGCLAVAALYNIYLMLTDIEKK